MLAVEGLETMRRLEARITLMITVSVCKNVFVCACVCVRAG